jgi:hypothetical protein
LLHVLTGRLCLDLLHLHMLHMIPHFNRMCLAFSLYQLSMSLRFTAAALSYSLRISRIAPANSFLKNSRFSAVVSRAARPCSSLISCTDPSCIHPCSIPFRGRFMSTPCSYFQPIPRCTHQSALIVAKLSLCTSGNWVIYGHFKVMCACVCSRPGTHRTRTHTRVRTVNARA